MSDVRESGALRFLYHTALGRVMLKLLSGRTVSRLSALYMDSPLSRPLIPSFVRKNGIDLSEYEAADYRCFNDFFTRQVRAECRPISTEPGALIAPCDGLLSAYHIREGLVLPVKQSRYSMDSLLDGDPVAAQYAGGVCLVFRLCVNHYHRYCYVDDGVKGENIFIPGRLHTVRPIALEATPVFTENCREYTVMETAHFGTVTQVEVGAMLVGKIQNLHGAGRISRGAEKGRFLYGGSTIILLLEPDRVRLPEKLFRATEQGVETPVRMGQVLGRSAVAVGS